MSRASVAHVMRAPIVGGSELETLAIVSALDDVDHHVLFPARFAGLQPSIRARFPVPVEAVPDLQHALDDVAADVVHVQFPFVLVGEPAGHDSVLELTRLPRVPTVFTVHAAVNVPVVPDVHYVFHTQRLAERFASAVPAARRTLCPSLVPVPPAPPPRRSGASPRILWVSRNEEAKFHPDVGSIVEAVLAADPHVRFRFVGACDHVRLPRHERVSSIPCPAPDLAAEYARADIFWYFPHPLLEETWCRTVTEAMANALPCVVAAHGAMSDQVRDGVHGRVVGDPRSCTAALLELARMDAAARSRLGDTARAAAIGFAQQCLATWRSLYRRLASGNGT